MTARQLTTVSPAGLDELPIGTFLILSSDALDGGPVAIMRLVQPNDPSPYLWNKLTPGGRLLYYFWRHFDGKATKRLGKASVAHKWRWIVEPHHPGYELLDAFKIACDHRRGQVVKPTLLYRALGLT